MDLELRQLRCLVAIVNTGSFTDAAIELGVSQAAVSRTLLSLEQVLGVRLLHRTSRSVTPTTAGVQVLAQARQLLADADNLVREATTGHRRLRIGHAWSALGRHTLEFQRRWAARYPDVELRLIRTNSTTGGLAEGLCDLAVVRTLPDERRFASAVVGRERRYCALAADDPWARRRSVSLEEVRDRTVAIDRRTGSTTTDLWPRNRTGSRAHHRHRRLAGRDRHRPLRRHHPREHRHPVPPPGHRLPPSTQRRPRPRLDDLAPPGPPPGHPRRRRPGLGPVPPGFLGSGVVRHQDELPASA